MKTFKTFFILGLADSVTMLRGRNYKFDVPGDVERYRFKQALAQNRKNHLFSLSLVVVGWDRVRVQLENSICRK